MKHCINCRIGYSDDFDFCSHCGNALSNGNLRDMCTACGHMLHNSNEKFCPNCGKRILPEKGSNIKVAKRKFSSKYVVIFTVIISLIIGGYLGFKQNLINMGIITPSTVEEQFMYSQHLWENEKHEEAVPWIIKSAEGGHAAAQGFYATEILIKCGRWEEAFEWLQKSAKNGHYFAQFTMGYIYDTSQTLLTDRFNAIKDDTTAFLWYELSANQNYAEAQFKIARMYEEGRGIPRSFIKAAEWYKKVLDNNYELCHIGFYDDVRYTKEKLIDLFMMYDIKVMDDSKYVQIAEELSKEDSLYGYNALEIWYRNGTMGLKKDISKANELRRKVNK